MASSSRLTNIIGGLRTRWHRAEHRIRRRLTWSRLYRATSYARSALWIVPFLSILAVLISVPILRVLDAWLQWDMMSLGVEGSKSMYQTVLTLNMSFLIFTFGSLLVAIQIAGGQLTPRVIATTLLRDNVVRYSVGLFVFTLVFAVGALNRQEASVNEVVSLVTGILGVACIADFLFLIDYAARLLRPVAVVARVGDEGVAMIKSVYPDPATALPPESATLREQPAMPSREVEHRGTSEIVLAVDPEELVLVQLALSAKAQLTCVARSGLPDASHQDRPIPNVEPTAPKITTIETIRGSKRDLIHFPEKEPQ